MRTCNFKAWIGWWRLIAVCSTVFSYVGIAYSDSHYVSLSGQHIAPFITLQHAATNIQAAIDVAEPGDVVEVDTGVYDAGSVMSTVDVPTRVNVDRAVTVRAMNSPSDTVISGGGGNIRGVYLAAGAVLEGMTVRDCVMTLNQQINGIGIYSEGTVTKLCRDRVPSNGG